MTADVIDLAERRAGSSSQGRPKGILIDPDSLRFAMLPDGSLSITVRAFNHTKKTVEWSVTAEEAVRLGERIERAKIQRFYAAVTPTPLPPPPSPDAAPQVTWSRCGLRRDGALDHSNTTACRRRRGHEGPHRDRTGDWTMPCPCPGSKTRNITPSGSRIGYAVCGWCGLERDEDGKPLPPKPSHLRPV